jgi:hypothetical protein
MISRILPIQVVVGFNDSNDLSILSVYSGPEHAADMAVVYAHHTNTHGILLFVIKLVT